MSKPVKRTHWLLFVKSIWLCTIVFIGCKCGGNEPAATLEKQSVVGPTVVTPVVVSTPKDTSATTSAAVINPTMDSAGRYIPIGIPMTYSDIDDFYFRVFRAFRCKIPY